MNNAELNLVFLTLNILIKLRTVLRIEDKGIARNFNNAYEKKNDFTEINNKIISLSYA